MLVGRWPRREGVVFGLGGFEEEADLLISIYGEEKVKIQAKCCILC
jgi:hypothetical protein